LISSVLTVFANCCKARFIRGVQKRLWAGPAYAVDFTPDENAPSEACPGADALSQRLCFGKWRIRIEGNSWN